ncbi:MAG: DUF2142 domain-containing protein, partial [Oscillospiraceae bacterium]|nr:DUF2142 domain-containing protein [Oscillospiraceae bacterium]
MIERASKFLKDKRRLLVSLALFFLCMLIFSFFMGQTVSAAPDKIRMEYLFDSPNTVEREIDKTALKQRIVFGKELYSVGFFVLGGEPEGTITCTVRDLSGNSLESQTKELTQIPRSGMAEFKFASPLSSPDHSLVIELKVESKAAVLIKTGAGAPDGWLLQNGSEIAGEAVILVAGVDRLGDFILVFYRVFALFLSASVALMYWLSSKLTLPYHRLFAVAAVLLGLLFCFLLPPYSSPDEQFHINEAFTISSRLLNKMPEERIRGKENVKRAGDENAVVEELYTTAFSYKAIANDFFSLSADTDIKVHSGERVGGYQLLFWPAALGVTLARLFGLGFVPALFFGRFANLSVYILLLTLAVKYAPLKKSVFALVGLLPMTLHLAASFNRDMLTIGLYVFITAYCLNLILEKEAVTIKNLIVLFGASAVALPAKVIYAPLLLMILLIPNDKITVRGKKVAQRTVRLAKYLLILLGALFFVATALPYIRSALKPPVEASVATHPDMIVYKIPYILAHPKDTVWLVVNTLFSNTAFYLNTLVGGSLGYYNIAISWVFVLALYLLLAAAMLTEKGELSLGGKTRFFGAAFALISSLLVVWACINWTPIHFLTIYGIQGRYFLPQLPLLLTAAGGAGYVVKTKNIDRPLLFAVFAISAFTVLNAFLVILER